MVGSVLVVFLCLLCLGVCVCDCVVVGFGVVLCSDLFCVFCCVAGLMCVCSCF